MDCLSKDCKAGKNTSTELEPDPRLRFKLSVNLK